MCFTEIKIKLHYQHGILCQGVDGGKGDKLLTAGFERCLL